MAASGLFGALGAWSRNHVFAPDYETATHHTVQSDDGTPLHVVALAGPANCGVTVMVVPGFGHWHRHAKIVEFAEALARHANVLVVELRGHGHSGGVSTLGAIEHRDVAAAVNLVPKDDAFVLIGMSMGAAASIVFAATAACRPDALVLISGPGWWTGRQHRNGVSRLVDAANSGLMRAGMRVFMHVRTGPIGDTSWHEPIDVIGSLAPMPIVLVHDRNDHYFAADQVEGMARAGGDNVRVWWRDRGHATDLLTPDLYADLLREVIAPVAR